MSERKRSYTAVIEAQAKGRARVPVPFDPNEVWGQKREHHVSGTVAGNGVRGTIGRAGDGWSFSVGPAWLRDCPIELGVPVPVVIEPEGPQRDDLAPDIAAALEANPAAGEFFDSLAQFYRNAYLRWIDATKRRPDVRAQRIIEFVQLLSDGIKARP